MIFDEVDTINFDGLVKLKYKPHFDLNDDVYVFRENDKYGVATYTGNIIYENVFEEALKADDFVIVSKNSKRGLINNKGGLIVPLDDIDIDYIFNCKRFIYRDHHSCKLVTKNQDVIYESSNIIHIGKDLFLSQDENIIIDAFGNKIMNAKNKSTYVSRYDFIIEIDENDKTNIFYNRSGDFLYKTKKKYSFLGGRAIVIFKKNKVLIYDLVNNKEVKMPNNFIFIKSDIDMKLGFLILQDKNNNNDECLFNIHGNIIYLDESLNSPLIYEITDKYIYGTHWDKNGGIKSFLCDLNGKCVSKGYFYIKRLVDDTILVQDNYDRITAINLRNDSSISLKGRTVNYSNGYFLVYEDNDYLIYDKNFNLIYSSGKKITLIESNDEFLLLSVDSKKVLLNKEGNIIIDSSTLDITLINNHIVLYDGYVINFNDEYLNLVTDYKLIVRNHVFHNKSNKDRVLLKNRIKNEINGVIDEYLTRLSNENDKVYVKSGCKNGEGK